MPTVNASAIALLYCALLLHPLHCSVLLLLPLLWQLAFPLSLLWHCPPAAQIPKQQKEA